MEYPKDRQPTNKVLYLVTRLDGSRLRVDGGEVGAGNDLPAPGDGKVIAGVGCRITEILKTPNLDYSWHIEAVEH